MPSRSHTHSGQEGTLSTDERQTAPKSRQIHSKGPMCPEELAKAGLGHRRSTTQKDESEPLYFTHVHFLSLNLEMNSTNTEAWG